MDCARAKEELSAYLDGMLEPDEKQQLERHIASCASCKEELAQLKSYAKTMAALPKVKAPEDFLKKVKERIERRSEFDSVIRGFFKPSANKTRAGAVLVTAVMIFAIYKLVAPQFSVYEGQPVEEKLGMKGQFAQKSVARKADAVESAGVTYEAYKKIAPVPVASAPASVAADSMQSAETAIREVRNPIKLQARLTAVHADGISMSLDDASIKIMESVENEGGTFKKLDSHEADRVLLHFTIPAAAYSNFIKQIEQIASVQGPDSSEIPDLGSIDVDLSIHN